MDKLRKVRKTVTGKNAFDGAGVKLVRVIGYSDTKEFDPFLMLDAFDSKNPDDYIKGFPWHPHRGIETVTYLIHGDIEHRDSLGNKGSIMDGDCQWMTAGSGIIHQEMPKPREKMLGVQLWLNLPAKFKMTDPGYGDIKSEKIPVIDEAGSKIKIIAGDYRGRKGAFEGKYVKATALDVEILPETEWQFSGKPEATLFIYIVSGEGCFDPEYSEVVDAKHAVLFSQGETVRVKSTENGIRFLLFTADSLREPIAWGGPIVMNTADELDEAFQELEENTFIKNSSRKSE